MKRPEFFFTAGQEGPPLDKIKVNFNNPGVDWSQYPFSLNLIKNLKEITFPTKVTFFVGENGSGKSTILEAIANKAGLGAEGGSKNIHFKTSAEKTYLGAEKFGQCLTLSWRRKPLSAYFFRAESFFNIANYIDSIAQEDHQAYNSYGGKSLHEQSHGESFLAFFLHRLNSGGFFILDEPEAALSPQRQLSLLHIIHEQCKNPATQFIIATHSPLLLAYPNSTIYSCGSLTLTRVDYVDTEHYQITRKFLENPDLYLKHLFKD